MRFEIASIRRKTRSLVGSMSCWVQVLAGEEVITTPKKTDTRETPPCWSETYLTIMVPESLKTVDIVVMGDDAEIGRLSMSTDVLLATSSEQYFN
jgi:hypothetical protein